jgi:tetratricopeptide (TPR) repeat protein
VLVQVRFALWLVSAAMLVPAAALAESAVPAPVASATAPEQVAFPPCDHGPSSSDLSAAKGAFQAGWVSFDEGDYARAITYWEDAFRRDCTAMALLLNLARAYELAGMLDEAVGALQTYLERVPESPERDSIQRRIEVLTEKIAETKPSEPVPVEPRPPEPARAPEAPSPTPVEPAPPPDQPTERSIVPLVLSGVGAVALLGGGAVYLSARHAVDDYAEQCDAGSTRVCPDDETRDAANGARTRVQIGSVVSLAGAAATVGGLVWYFMSPPTPTQVGTDAIRGRLALEPNVAPGFAGVVVLGAY